MIKYVEKLGVNNNEIKKYKNIKKIVNIILVFIFSW